MLLFCCFVVVVVVVVDVVVVVVVVAVAVVVVGCWLLVGVLLLLLLVVVVVVVVVEVLNSLQGKGSSTLNLLHSHARGLGLLPSIGGQRLFYSIKLASKSPWITTMPSFDNLLADGCLGECDVVSPMGAKSLKETQTRAFPAKTEVLLWID